MGRADASTARSVTSFPANDPSPIRKRAGTWPGCGVSSPNRFRRQDIRPWKSWKRSIQGEIKALLSICFNPLVSLPDANFTAEALKKLEFFSVIDFFMSETAQYADVIL